LGGGASPSSNKGGIDGVTDVRRGRFGWDGTGGFAGLAVFLGVGAGLLRGAAAALEREPVTAFLADGAADLRALFAFAGVAERGFFVGDFLGFIGRTGACVEGGDRSL
jgi:hypothetical protein